MARAVLAIVALFALANAQTSSPTLEVIDGNLMFITNSVGARIGYKYGASGKVVMFDEFSSRDSTIGQQIQQAYLAGKEAGLAEAQISGIQSNQGVQDMLKQYATLAAVDRAVTGEADDRKLADDDIEEDMSRMASMLTATFDLKLKNLEGQVFALDEDVKSLSMATAAPGGVNASINWVAMAVDSEDGLLPSYPCNQNGQILKIYGSGLQGFYHPSIESIPGVSYQDLTCMFYNQAGKYSLNVSATIVPLDGAFFHVECAAPKATSPIVWKVILLNVTQVIPFVGLPNRDVLYADQYWDGVIGNNVTAGGLVLKAVGMPEADLDGLITCVSTNLNVDGGRVENGNIICKGLLKGLPPNDGFFLVPITIFIADVHGNRLRELKWNPYRAQPSEHKVPYCNNGVQDGDETDVDCGGRTCIARCAPNKKCKVTTDCQASGSQSCTATGVCSVGDGSANSPAETCKTLKRDFPTKRNGIYYITGKNNTASAKPIPVFCWLDGDNQRDGGGWTMVLKTHYDGTFDGARDDGVPICSAANEYGCRSVCGEQAIGSPDTYNAPTGRFKLEDSFIRDGIIGPTNTFDVMVDQIGVNSYYSADSYEYLIMKNFVARWQFDRIMEPSRSAVRMSSFRISDNQEVWTGELKCGVPGGVHPHGKGINCYGLAGPNPAGGAGCKAAMGKYTDPGWHHIYMFEHNSDSYVYVCNGAQHSSGYSMSHRWFFREVN